MYRLIGTLAWLSFFVLTLSIDVIKTQKHPDLQKQVKFEAAE